MKRELTASAVKTAKRHVDWPTIGDNKLLEMCREHPHHRTLDEIWSKAILIGRTYAAAVERRKTLLGVSNIRFYREHVVRTMRGSGIDRALAQVRRTTPGTPAALLAAAQAHCKLVAKLNGITGIDKRSFAAKYLHFHAPKHFFLYDRFSREAMSGYRIRLPKGTVPTGDKQQQPVDVTYASFAARCMVLTKRVRDEFRVRLSPRELDYLLQGAG